MEDLVQVSQVPPGAPTWAKGARDVQETCAPVYTSGRRTIAAGKQTPGERTEKRASPGEHRERELDGDAGGQRVTCPGPLGKRQRVNCPCQPDKEK